MKASYWHCLECTICTAGFEIERTSGGTIILHHIKNNCPNSGKSFIAPQVELEEVK